MFVFGSIQKPGFSIFETEVSSIFLTRLNPSFIIHKPIKLNNLVSLHNFKK